MAYWLSAEPSRGQLQDCGKQAEAAPLGVRRTGICSERGVRTFY